MGSYNTPIPLSEIESVLSWVDGFKLSRPTKKINRDFSDAVLLAEILAVHYPKLVEMHNYPPRNSHALKLNNWMTLNRKVLKKLKLNLCCNTMEQLANCSPRVIERVLVMVRDKIQRDIEASKIKDDDPNLSSGGSYYEALGDDEHVLVVPVKTRINGVLETHQQKVVSHESYLALKEELKDAKDTVELLKQKVEHVDNLLKLKEERIEELHKQLERKQIRRKEAETLINSLCVPFDTVPNPAPISIENSLHTIKETSETRTPEALVLEKKNTETLVSIGRKTPSLKSVSSKGSVHSRSTVELNNSTIDSSITKEDSAKEIFSVVHIELEDNLDRIKSDVFEDIVNDDADNNYPDAIEVKDVVQNPLTTIEDSIQREIKGIILPLEYNIQKANYQ